MLSLTSLLEVAAMGLLERMSSWRNFSVKDLWMPDASGTTPIRRARRSTNLSVILQSTKQGLGYTKYILVRCQ